MEGVEEFNNTQFNFFEAKEKYLQRVRDISDNNDDNNNNNNNNNNNGGKRRHRLSNTNEVLVNPNPVLFFKDDVERHREVFENLKVAYMEQDKRKVSEEYIARTCNVSRTGRCNGNRGRK